MTFRILAPLALAGLLTAGSAAADSYPDANACNLFARDLRQDLMLVGKWAANRAQAEAALEEGLTLCQQGQADAGIEVLKSGILALGLPLSDHHGA